MDAYKENTPQYHIGFGQTEIETDDLTPEKWAFLNRSYDDRNLKFDEWCAMNFRD